jgi:DNA processing protein
VQSNEPRSGVCHPGDADYPSALDGLPSAPRQLFWTGTVWPPPRHAVAIVGTRAASPYGLEIAEQLAADLARAGVCVVSGMARGIDSAAHRGALEAGGSTVAVLAAGPGSPYPPESAAVHARLLAHGAACAEFPSGTPLRRGLFPRRNRILAGLALGVVVVEAGEKSGALTTASWSRRYGRFRAAVPGDVTRDGARGVLRLLQDGASAVGSARDVLARMSAAAAAAQSKEDETMELMRRLSRGPVHPDRLARELGVPLPELLSRLARLEIAGAVRRRAGGGVERAGA